MYPCHKPLSQSRLQAVAQSLPRLPPIPVFCHNEALDVDWEESMELLEILETDFDEVAILP